MIGERDVSSISDEELLRRAVKGLTRRYKSVPQRWVAVMHAFALGSTFSQQLCVRFGLDPDEPLKGKIR